MLNLLRAKSVPKPTICNTQFPVQRWRLRNLHSSPLKSSFINTDRRFLNKIPSFCNNSKLTKSHLFGQFFYRQQHHQVPEKYKKYSTTASDEADDLMKKKEDWGPAYSDEIINEIDRRRKMKWMKEYPKGVPKKEDEVVPPELHRIIPPIPLGGEHRYESKWQWPRKIFEMEQQSKEWMEKGRDFVRWKKKWKDRYNNLPSLSYFIYNNARFPKLFITRRRTFWMALVALLLLWFWDFRYRTGYYQARELEEYIKKLLKNPMIPPSAVQAENRLHKIRTDEAIHRFASKPDETLPILEIHTSRYNEPCRPGDMREDDQIKIHVNQPGVDMEDTLDMFTDQLGEYKLWQVPPIVKPKPETRKYPLTKLPRPDLETIPEAPAHHLEQHMVQHPVVAGQRATPTFFVGMFDQHNTRHAQDFVASQLIDYVKLLLDWKRKQQVDNDWIKNHLHSKKKFDRTSMPEEEYQQLIADELQMLASQLANTPPQWNKDDVNIRSLAEEVAGEKDPTKERVDHIILKLRNIYDISRAIPAAFMKAFVTADHDYMMESWLNPEKFQQGFSGACAMVSMFFNRWLFVGSVGDFRAFVIKRSFDELRDSYHWSNQSVSFPATVLLDAEVGTRTHQHKLHRGLIVDQNGFGFGTRKLQQWKDAAKTKDPLDTTAEPHLNSYQIQKDDSLVVMVSPGVLNVMKVGEITDMLSKKMDEIAFGEHKPENLASMIVYAAAARSKELLDPLSATVVMLNPKYHEQVEPIHTIPEMFDVKIPKKRFEYFEAWADNVPRPSTIFSWAESIGEWTEDLSATIMARLSKRWELQVKPQLSDTFATPFAPTAPFAELRASLSRAWKDFRGTVEEPVTRAIDLSKGYVSDYVEQTVDDQYYRWLKRSVMEEWYPSHHHIKQFIQAARERGRDLALADKMEAYLMWYRYSTIKAKRRELYYAGKNFEDVPTFPPDLVAWYKKHKNVDISQFTLPDDDKKAPPKKKAPKFGQPKPVFQQQQPEEVQPQEEEEEGETPASGLQAVPKPSEKEGKQATAKSDVAITKEDLESEEYKEHQKAVEEEKKSAKQKEAEERRKQEEKYREEMHKLNEELFQIGQQKIYLDPTLIIVKTPDMRRRNEDEKELPWQALLRRHVYKVNEEERREYHYVIGADVILAALSAASSQEPDAEQVASFLTLQAKSTDLSSIAQREAFYESYTDEVLKKVPLESAEQELQRRHPEKKPKRTRKQQQSRRKQQQVEEDEVENEQEDDFEKPPPRRGRN